MLYCERLEQMHFQVKVVLAFLISFICTQQGYCDEISIIKNWTCKCLYSHQENQSHTIESNCSTSCNCNHDTGSRNIWTCICSADGLPKVADGDHNANCFRACNCTSGSLGEAHSSKKHISSKSVVIILLMGVILTSFAFVASVTFYFYRKEKYRIQSPVFSSDRETSFNSATNLINHKTYSKSEPKMDTYSSIEHITGCFYRSSCLFGSNKGTTIPRTITQFAFSELQNATGKFSNSNLIGNGASSYVYRGELKDGRIVAVKRLNSHKGSDAESVFLTEIELLSRLHHCHVVPMVGYCSESHRKHTERVLVYDYQRNGNLRECLDGALGKKMGWGSRVAIAIGAAKGLEYLHEAAAPRILHRDIKSTNILLDENWQAKITDLGMAKHFKTGFSSCSDSPARMQGTFGYFAPEYAIVGRASLKSDVFSFGVVVLELITGRHPIHKSTAKGEESLVIWATPRLLDSKRVITELPDPRLDGKFPEQEMHIMAYLAKECLQLDPDDRPTMSEVVQILSAIAPERSRRRIISRSSSYCMKNEQYKDKHDLNPTSRRAEKLRHVESCKCSDRHSHPQDDYSMVENAKENACSAEYMDGLILLTSKTRSSHALDDETLDLTEPRFESFCMDNVDSPDKFPIMDKGLRQAR